MKTFFTVCFAIFSSTLMAADLFVQEFGGGGTYSNISDAITAANAGDRIFIVPKAGNAPYIESLTINKPLQLLTASNASRFKLQGSVTINTNLPVGAHVVIDGLWITTGSISAAASTNIIDISIVNSRIEEGEISLAQNIHATIANNIVNTTSTVNSAISFRRGKCLGNSITTGAYGIIINNDAVASTDTIPVVGNHIIIQNSTSAIKGIHWSNNTQFFLIANNYIYYTVVAGHTNTNYYLLEIGLNKSGANANEYNNIVNNTLRFALGAPGINTSRFLGIRAGNLGSRNNIFNNIIRYDVQQTLNNRDGLDIGGTPQISYNVVHNTTTTTVNIGNAPTDGTNWRVTSLTYTIDTHGCVAGGILLDAGHPDPIFTDLDLTRNDIGACGGSYNIMNFRNNGTAGSAKVHWLVAPRRVMQGGTINIQGEGHDR